MNQIDAEEWQAGWLLRHPSLFDIHSEVVLGVRLSSRNVDASYVQGYIELGEKFFNHPLDSQDYIYAHEIGHGIESTLGSDWREMAEELGIDLWDTSNLPLGTFNQDEAMAETLAVLMLEDPIGTELLHYRWPAWEKLGMTILYS